MSRDIIIFVNAIRPKTFQALKDYGRASGRHFTPIVLVDKTIKDAIFACNGQYNLPQPVDVVTADFNSAFSVREALKPYEGRMFAVTSQYENCIQELRKLLPYVPYIPTPSEKSLEWSTEKKLMRRMLEAYDAGLVPKYLEVADDEPPTLDTIEKTMSYPMVVKPSGLEGSLLVSYIKNRQELDDTLRRTFRAIQDSYDTWVKRQKPMVLVEEFMVGNMYTIDVYIDDWGNCRYAPVVGSIVGREVGYDDLFPYTGFLPSGLDEIDTAQAQQAAEKACHALGLRSVTAHVEMMRTSVGWKIIELGPRIGGYRYELYQLAYGINHIVNDIRNRAGEVPEIPATLNKYVSVFDIYARKEGTLKTVHGLEDVKGLASFTYLKQNIFEGQQALFAKNGGDVAVNIMLSHENKAQLEADIATMETTIVLEVA